MLRSSIVIIFISIYTFGSTAQVSDTLSQQSDSSGLEFNRLELDITFIPQYIMFGRQGNVPLKIGLYIAWMNDSDSLTWERGFRLGIGGYDYKRIASDTFIWKNDTLFDYRREIADIAEFDFRGSYVIAGKGTKNTEYSIETELGVRTAKEEYVQTEHETPEGLGTPGNVPVVGHAETIYFKVGVGPGIAKRIPLENGAFLLRWKPMYMYYTPLSYSEYDPFDVFPYPKPFHGMDWRFVDLTYVASF